MKQSWNTSQNTDEDQLSNSRRRAKAKQADGPMSRSQIMRRVTNKDSAAEMALRSRLFEEGRDTQKREARYWRLRPRGVESTIRRRGVTRMIRSRNWAVPLLYNTTANFPKGEASIFKQGEPCLTSLFTSRKLLLQFLLPRQATPKTLAIFCPLAMR